MLSEIQNKIVNAITGPVLVVSCPGSGKTTVVVNRTYQMIKQGIRPENILVITFTKEAATEMESRFKSQFGINGVSFGTIHSFCFKVLIQHFGYKKEDILTGAQQYVFLAKDMRNHSGKVNEDKVKALMSNISYCRNLEIDPTRYIPEDESISKDEFFAAFVKYTRYKEQIGKIDFDDMLFKTRELLEENPHILEYWQNRYTYLMVDEYQDTSMVQSDICNMLADKNQNICVVGDDDQSIYRFRGAKVETILHFKDLYKNANVFQMGTNYRSTQEIVKRASMLIKNNTKRYKKDFVANRTEEGSVSVKKCKTSGTESASVFREIEELHNSGVAYQDMAILYRTNVQNQMLIPYFMKKNIPFYTTETPVDIHDEVMYGDVMCYYRLANEIGSTEDLLRILNRPARYLKKEWFNKTVPTEQGLLKTAYEISKDKPDAVLTIKTLIRHLKALKNLPPAEFLSYMEIFLSYYEAIDKYADFVGKNRNNLHEIWKMLKKEAEAFSSMAEWQAYGLTYKEELAKRRKENHKKGVCLSTFHSAKGLEWKEVFVLDANEGYCPHKKATTQDDHEEERRLFYVGITRAKDNCRIYYIDESSKDKGPSRYLYEMGLIKK